MKAIKRKSEIWHWSSYPFMSRVDGTVNRYVRSVLNGYHELWFVLNLTLHDRMCEQGIKSGS